MLNVLLPTLWLAGAKNLSDPTSQAARFVFPARWERPARRTHDALRSAGFESHLTTTSGRFGARDSGEWTILTTRVPAEVIELGPVSVWPAPTGLPVDERAPEKVAADAFLAADHAAMHAADLRRTERMARVAAITQRTVEGRRRTSAEHRSDAWIQAWVGTTRSSTGAVLNDRPTSPEADDANERLVAELLLMRQPLVWSVDVARECARITHPARFVGSTKVFNEASLYTDTITFWSPRRQAVVRGAALILEAPGSEDRYDAANPRLWMGHVDAEAAAVLGPVMPGVREGAVLVMPFLASRTRNGFIQDADERDQVRDLLPLYLVLDDDFAALQWHEVIDTLQFEARRARSVAATLVDGLEPEVSGDEPVDQDFAALPWKDSDDDLPEWYWDSVLSDER